MQNTVPFQSQRSVAGTKVAQIDGPIAFQFAGVSTVWRKLLLQAQMAAPHVQVASIEGESGSGKQTIARYLLSRSAFAASGFHRCDAREWLLSDGDLATLSGFTYLDRVDLLAPPGQGLLLGILKSLQDRQPARVMLVASSQVSLRQMAGQGQMLPDLAFRLTAVRFAVPPLRARKEDIGPLSQALLDRICTRYQHRPMTLGPSTLGRLLQHNWPGNVRELASVLEAALLEAIDDVIRPGDLPLTPGLAPGLTPGLDAEPQLSAPTSSASLALDDVIRRHVEYVLDLNRGNKLRAARQLGISRSTLYRIVGNDAILAH